MSDSSELSDSDSSINGDIDKIDSKDPSEVLKILVTTDNHLGYMEKDSGYFRGFTKKVSKYKIF